jgi:methylated-DNA-[protein]-cysteine S-methyltransferase
MTPQTLRFTSVATPLGDFTILVSERGVVTTIFGEQERDAEIAAVEERFDAPARSSTRALSDIRRDVEAYFAGRQRTFSTPPDLILVPEGFHRRVLATTVGIPYGELWTYGDVAAMAGNPGAARAAGSALSHCPIELFVPCHRVVHAGGTLGGYGRYEDRKGWLLRHEGAI